MPEEADYGPRDTNDEVESQIREEKQERAEEINFKPRSDGATVAMQAVLAERERCAKVAESSQVNTGYVDDDEGYNEACIDIAAKIRSGK